MMRRAASPWLALLPMVVVVLVVYAGGLLWTSRVSLSSSATFPVGDFVGLAQYVRLSGNERWLVSVRNGAVFTATFVIAALLTGSVLAVVIDRKLRCEALLRGVFIYPYALSFVAAGLAWQWMLNPGLGLQQAVRNWGLESFTFDWIVDQRLAIFAIAVATVWQAAGLVMTIVLAGLRGIDESIWHAARVDGIATWRVYVRIVLPMLGPSFGTAFILLLTIAVKLFDPVVAMTQGGPGLASEVPAKFVMDHLFGRANLGLASAAAVSLTVMALALLAPFVWARRRAVTAREAR